MSTINYLDISCKIVLKGIEIAKKADPTRNYHSEIRKASEHMSNQWKNQWRSGEEPKLQYDQAINRLAYVHVQMPANAYVVEQVFSDEKIKEHFKALIKKNKKVSVCVFGAGPGTEILGIAGWIRQESFLELCQVDFTLFDVQEQWKSSLELSLSTVKQTLEPTGFVVKGTCYLNCDAKADLRDFQMFDKAKEHDIYIFPYILSEIPNNIQALTDFARKLAPLMNKGAKLIFIDRYSEYEQHTILNMRAIMSGMGGCLLEKKIPHKEIPSNQWSFRNRTDIKQLWDEINWHARRKINAFYAIGEKAIIDDIPF